MIIPAELYMLASPKRRYEYGWMLDGYFDVAINLQGSYRREGGAGCAGLLGPNRITLIT
jgi:hypothetical protein